MGLRGPKKEPAAVQKLKGNPSKAPVIEPVVIPEGEPFIPPHLNEDAQACIEQVKRAMPPGVYASVDSYALSAFATAWAWHKHAAHRMAAPDFQPVSVDEKGTDRPSPWFRILNAASAEMRSWGDRLGLTPAARANLKLPGQGEQKSKFAGLVALKASFASLNS